MTNRDAEKLDELLGLGYQIKIDHGPYLDGFVKSITETEVGKFVYESNVYIDSPLSKIPRHSVCVYKDVTNEVFKGE